MNASLQEKATITSTVAVFYGELPLPAEPVTCRLKLLYCEPKCDSTRLVTGRDVFFLLPDNSGSGGARTKTVVMRKKETFITCRGKREEEGIY